MIELVLERSTAHSKVQLYEALFFLEKWDEHAQLRVLGNGPQMVDLMERFLAGAKAINGRSEVWQVRLSQCEYATIEEVSDV